MIPWSGDVKRGAREREERESNAMDRKRDQEFRQNKNKRTVEIVDETSLDHGMRINYQLR